MITEAIVLAGGLGTRLRSVVSDVPKCLAIVDGEPFLHYIIHYLKKNGITKFIFSLGYKSELIISFLNEVLSPAEFEVTIEDEPLGTGGAIQLAAQKTTEKDVIIVNGDTFFDVDLKQLFQCHSESQAECTLALKPMHNFSRYGAVEFSGNTITSFKEKQFYDSGLINGGVYALRLNAFFGYHFPEKFSFEKDYLETYISTQHIKGFIQDGYFIDIGIPEDYEKAKNELRHHTS